MSQALLDVVCWIVSHGAKEPITARVEKHGGKVAARLGKEVTHIVWERRHSRRPSDKAADEAELLELFRKLEKMDYPPVVVSPLWVEESIKAGRRLVERKFLVKKPTESLLGRTPGSGAGAAAKKRKRPAAAALPKPAEAYELDDLVFSSTQQMHNDLAGPNNMDDVSSPRGGGSGAAGGGARQQQAQRGRGRQAGAGSGKGGMLTVVEEAEEEGDDDEVVIVEESSEQGQQQQLAGIGTETQAVANILTVDLPDEQHGCTPGGAGLDQDELDTPLALRFAKSSAERAAARAAGSAERAHHGGASGCGGEKRSRLAQASGPHEQQEQQQAEAAAGEADDMMQVDEPWQQEQQQEEQQPESKARDTAAAAAKGVAQRFSVRQLVKHPEKPVLVHKGTPLPGSLPSSPESKPADPIPIPVVERVTSPWTLAEQVPSQSQPSQPAAAPPSVEGPSGRPSIGQPLPKPTGRRSLLGVSNVRRASIIGAATGGGAGASATPPSVQEQGKGAEEGRPLPSPWSTLRPWDGKAAQAQQQQQGAGEAAAAPADQDENKAGPPQQQPEPAASGQQQAAAQAEPQPAAGSSRGRRQQQALPAAAAGGAGSAALLDSDAPGPSNGCIALSSVDAGVVDLARSATRRLRGMRLCPEGKEDGAVTHLVIGGERRTLKLMLAVANGAWLLSPQWVTASLEAGRWLPESQFPAQVRFEAAAERARSLLEMPDALPLLHEHSIYIHLPEKARKLMGANVAALRRVAAVLGAKVVSPKACTTCVVVGGGARPPSIPKKAQCVKEEWLLQAAERFEVPAVEDYMID